MRATEARRPDSVIDDPMAIKLVDAIDFDFAKFGFTRRQDMALRALTFDHYTRRYLIDHPSATVVALAEGLQTSFYRLDASGVGDQFRWLTVDLPPIIELRDRLLPHSDRVSMCAQSALDFSWMDRVDPSEGVFITTEGLLMYLQPDEALGPDRRMRQAISGRADDVRSAAGVLRLVDTPRLADVAALPGAADAVHPVTVGYRKPGQHACRASAPCMICRWRRAAAKC